jgi:membrane-anchored protein YejM (alkaline phosphatase superfamily)
LNQKAHAPNTKNARIALYLVAWLVWIGLVIFGLGYLRIGNSFTSPISSVFSVLALLSQMGIFVLVFLALPLSLTSLSLIKTGKSIAATLFTMIVFFIYIDLKLYELFRFHFNAFAVNVVFTPGGFATMGISAIDLTLFCGLFFVTGTLLLVLLHQVDRRLTPRLLMAKIRPGLWLFTLIFFCAASERALYAWADYTDNNEVTRNTDVLPFYEPFLIRGNVVELFGDHQKSLAIATSTNESSRLFYSDKSLSANISKPFNVVIMVIESVRADMLDPQVMPHLTKLAKRSQNFMGHHSGGNSTRFGIFSLAYGMDGLYWHSFLSERRGPALFSVLRNHGYDQLHLTSARMDYPEFRQTVFVNDLAHLDDQLSGKEPWQKDDEILNKFSGFLDDRRSDPQRKPFFSFLFLDGPHGPYSFPPEETVFSAGPEAVTSYFEILDKEKAQQSKARYKNSIHYADRNIGKLVAALEASGELEDTIIYVTGDHGQEFWEYGYFGHNGAFNPMQAMVPSVLHIPGRSGAVFDHWTEHRDIVPTLFAELGVDLDAESISNGRNLFDAANRDHTISCSFSECALRDANGWMVFGTHEKKSLKLQFFDQLYKPVDRTQGATSSRLSALRDFFGDRRFFAQSPSP